MLRLNGARVTCSARVAERRDLVIVKGRIVTRDSGASAPEIDLSGCLVLPGLINAHDHLEFNLFPRLGSGPYGNAVEWAHAVYHPERSPVKEQLALPKALRLLWGGLKNLLSGVTTVAHHNPYVPEVFGRRFPVRVVRNFGWVHSLHFTPDVACRFRETPTSWPFVIHAAEGSDASAYGEIARLDALGVLSKRTVIVHGVALRPQDLQILRARGCSIVWCPSSNLFTCGCTIAPETLEAGIPIALGTDSALSAKGDLVDEIQTARQFPKLSNEQIFEMVTTSPARILRLPDGAGQLRHGSPADLVVIRDTGKDPCDCLTDLRPELVIVAGRIRLISRLLLTANPHLIRSQLYEVSVPERGDWFVDVDMPALRRSTEQVLGSDFRLAGKQVLA
jgi:cytosine/adenosine deaminase-related metal-dependent hydrolase